MKLLDKYIKRFWRFMRIRSRKNIIEKGTPGVYINIFLKSKLPQQQEVSKTEYKVYAEELQECMETVGLNKWKISVVYGCGEDYMQVAKDENICIIVTLTNTTTFFTKTILYGNNHDIPVIVFRNEENDNSVDLNSKESSSLNYFSANFKDKAMLYKMACFIKKRIHVSYCS